METSIVEPVADAGLPKRRERGGGGGIPVDQRIDEGLRHFMTREKAAATDVSY
jgi:hypothetical protein